MCEDVTRIYDLVCIACVIILTEKTKGYLLYIFAGFCGSFPLIIPRICYICEISFEKVCVFA
jgi:hypothetical protein